jgi:YVTN family beta-propeller protein
MMKEVEREISAWIGSAKGTGRIFVTNEKSSDGLSDDIVIIETASHTALTSIPVGQVPYAILIDDE